MVRPNLIIFAFSRTSFWPKNENERPFPSLHFTSLHCSVSASVHILPILILTALSSLASCVLRLFPLSLSVLPAPLRILLFSTLGPLVANFHPTALEDNKCKL